MFTLSFPKSECLQKVKFEVLTHRFPFVTLPGPSQAMHSPNCLSPDSQTFPKQLLSVAQALSKVLTHTLNKLLPRGNYRCRNRGFGNLQCQSQEFDQYMR